MASKTITNFVDDLDGTSEADFPGTAFALDGVSYEIDLSTENRERLDAALAEYVAVARRTGGRLKSPAGTKKASADPAQLQHMREWGRANGFTVNDRGRLSGELTAAYHEAQEAKAATAKPAARRKRTPAKATKATA